MTQKPIQLLFRIKLEKIKEEIDIKIWCKNNYAITWMSNSEVLQKLVNAEKNQGHKVELAYDKEGKLMAIQLYKDKTGKQIAKQITRELRESTGGKFTSTKRGVSGKRTKIISPLLRKNKRDIINMGYKLRGVF